MPRPLHRRRDAALMARARAGSPAWEDFATIRDMALQASNILIIRGADLVGAEHTDLPPWRIPPPAACLGRSTATFARIHAWGRRSAATIIISAAPLAARAVFVSHRLRSLSTYSPLKDKGH